MAKVLVLYYSMYGHIETMANAVAEGARSVSGAEVTVKRVPETMPCPETGRTPGDPTRPGRGSRRQKRQPISTPWTALLRPLSPIPACHAR